MRLAIRSKIIRHQIIITVLYDSINQGREGALVAKHSGLDGGEDCFKVRVEGEFGVEVGVAEVFDVFGEVAEEEDVLVADFAGYFDLLSTS
jgi:hypothetical protein